jgi:alkaline phosphatase D
MPGGTVGNSTPALSAVDGSSELETVALPTTGLIAGNNILAVEIHQSSATSSDVSFSLTLTGISNTPTVTHSPWSGGVTSSSARVKARVSMPNVSTRLVVSSSPNLSSPLYSSPVTSSAARDNVVDLFVNGLTPNTVYYYGLELNGVLSTDSTRRGRFQTFPQGAASFKFAFGSCGDFQLAGQEVYDAVQAENPLFFLSMGDLHYKDTNVADTSAYWNNYKSVLSTVNQAALFRNVSLAYVWDDHDAAGNDTNKNYVGLPSAQQAYRDYVPSYPLASASGPINQAFTVGRSRFILSDLRSLLDPPTNVDDSTKTTMGATQKTWLKNEFLAAKNNGAKVIFWVSSFPYISNTAGEDIWGSYATERREIADFLKANNIRNVVILSGDMHALAYDDGRNSDYATGGGMPLRVAHAAALARAGSIKGGPYLRGAFASAGQYGTMEVTDNGGDTVTVRFVGKHYINGVRIDETFSFTTTGTQPVADLTYDFSDTSGQFASVDGPRPGGINFGSNQWGAGDYFGFNSQSGWFKDDSQDNRSFILPTGTRLKSIKLSTDVMGSTWKIEGGSNPTHSNTFTSAGVPITVYLNDWTQPSPTVKITFSAKWDSGIDDIVYGQ